jgi:hypothetical protein
MYISGSLGNPYTLNMGHQHSQEFGRIYALHLLVILLIHYTEHGVSSCWGFMSEQDQRYTVRYNLSVLVVLL